MDLDKIVRPKGRHDSADATQETRTPRTVGLPRMAKKEPPAQSASQQEQQSAWAPTPTRDEPLDIPAIEIRGLTKHFKSFVALDGLDLTVPRGEFHGLLGPNGAGKSTTLKLVTGLIRPTAGSASINGVDVTHDRKAALSGVGCLIETPAFYEGMTPREVLRYTGTVKGLNKEEINIRMKAVLEELRMYEWRDTAIDGFSKGMRQRVGLAQVLLSNPSVIILDEPTTGLDPRGMIEFRNILTDLRRNDMSMLLSTHNLSEVSTICGSVTILREGRSVASGKVSDLVKNFEGSVTLHLETVKPVTPEFLKDLGGLQGVKEIVHAKDTSVRLRFNGKSEEQSQIVDLAIKHGLGLVSFSEESGSDLEKLYMGLSVDNEEA